MLARLIDNTPQAKLRPRNLKTIIGEQETHQNKEINRCNGFFSLTKPAGPKIAHIRPEKQSFHDAESWFNSRQLFVHSSDLIIPCIW